MTFARSIARWAEAARARARLRRELSEIEVRGDLDGTLRDVGLTRSQLGPLIASYPASSASLSSMLARLGLEQEVVPTVALREMAWTCVGCTDKRRCHEWLAGGEETEFRAFCPNAALLDYELLKQHRGTA